MTANRFRYKVWVNNNIDLDGCDCPDDDLNPPVKKGWLNCKDFWFQLCPDGKELMWGMDENPLEPLVIGRDVTLCFSTGLLDCNGVEVFEGDILKAKWRHQLSSVFWSNGAFCGSNGTWNIGECGASELVVLGNIYENPKLLEAR